ncbi:MAG: hypothetical protein V1880_03605 [Patescibacteria group bacterium]
MTFALNGTSIDLDQEILSSLLFPVLSIIFFLLIFRIIVFAIKSLIGKVTERLPEGHSLTELSKIAKEFPVQKNWQEIKDNWDIRINRETGKITVKRKTDDGKAGDSTLKPTEIQVTELAQLPAEIRQLVDKTDQSHSPFPYELKQKLKRTALIVFVIALFYGLRRFFG